MTRERERAEESLRLVQVDPHEATRLATGTLADASAGGDLAAASIALRALGLAAVHVRDPTTAAAHLRKAFALAQQAGSPELVAEARMTLAFALNRQGRTRRALIEIEAALGSLSDVARARALVQRAAIRQQIGRLDEALLDYRSALPVLRRAEDMVWVQRVLLNRGVLHAFRQSYASAERDLHEAEKLCERMGLRLPAAFVQENLVLVHRRLGDVPTALRHVENAERLYRSLDAPTGSLLIERSELLLSVRLIAEARSAAERAVAELERSGQRLGIPEARLLLARTALLDHDPQTAVREARRAAREFQSQGRHEWLTLARFDIAMAETQARPEHRVSSRRLALSAVELEASGWVETSLEARLMAGREGLRSRRGGERHDQAQRQLRLVGDKRHTGPAARRAKAWYATALLRQDEGNQVGATRAAATGLRILDEHRATMAATDLRARIAGLGVELVRLGLRNAVLAGTPQQVLRWAELGRAREVTERPARPPDDPQLRQQLAELRSVTLDIDQRRRSGVGVGMLVHLQVQLEQQIRDTTRRERGLGSAGGSADHASLRTDLGDAALVELIELDGALMAVTLVAGRCELTQLGAMEVVREQVRWLPFGLRRLARQQVGGPSQLAAVSMVREFAERLDRTLFGPLRARLRDRPLVIVPTGVLQSMPWSLLPSLDDRPLTVAPSASLWQRASARAAAPGHIVAAAGPGLPGADREARDVAALWGTTALLGASATVAAVTDALEGAAVVHFAAHGRLRSDNPLFSALRLHDGPLTVYDLEQIDDGGDTVVLAACDSASNVVLAGDELLGLSAAFLARDTRHLVASVVPVPDAETAPLMVAFHQRLATGMPVAHALAAAQHALGRDDPATFGAAAGFVCLGAGFSPTAPIVRALKEDEPRDRAQTTGVLTPAARATGTAHL